MSWRPFGSATRSCRRCTGCEPKASPSGRPCQSSPVSWRFLNRSLGRFLVRFTDDGYLVSDGERYWLTASGEELGKRSFADEFADLTRPTHGECDEDCWCHSSPEEAARCLEERTHAH